MEIFLDTQQDDFTSLMLQNTMVMLRGDSSGAAPPSEMELALADYFDASAEALEMCRQLLRNVKSTQNNYQTMDRFLAAMAAAGTASTSSSASSLAVAEQEPSLFPVRSNPFCTTTRSNFRQIHDTCSAILQSCLASGRLAEELEEHVCLCLATIHKARVLVIHEISKKA